MIIIMIVEAIVQVSNDSKDFYSLYIKYKQKYFNLKINEGDIL